MIIMFLHKVNIGHDIMKSIPSTLFVQIVCETNNCGTNVCELVLEKIVICGTNVCEFNIILSNCGTNVCE